MIHRRTGAEIEQWDRGARSNRPDAAGRLEPLRCQDALVSRRTGQIEYRKPRGTSDANLVAPLGLPVLDGLGPIGGDDHSPSEWLDLESVVPRIALLAGLIASA